MVTTDQKSTIDTQETNRNPNTTLKKNHQTTKNLKKKKHKNNQKTSSKMRISIYISIITLNVNKLTIQKTQGG